MNKFFKFLAWCIWLLSAIHLLNKLIFFRARKKSLKVKDEQFYDTENGKIRYFTAGEGKPLLLLHGIYPGASILEWENTIKSLSKHYKVYALDLLGFGESAKPKMSYSAYLYTILINNFIEDVIKEKTSVIATSNSGAFAVLAQSFKPDNFEKLMLINPTGVGSTDVYSQASNFYCKLMANSPVLGTLYYLIITSKPVIKYFLGKDFFSKSYDIKEETTDKLRYYALKGGSNAKYPIAALISKYLNVSIETKMKKIENPVHVIWGTNCDINPIENARILEAINPDVQLSYFNGGKLLPHVEFAEQFNTICLGFFG